MDNDYSYGGGAKLFCTMNAGTGIGKEQHCC